ncbi:MAG: hypothetical protein K1X83_02640 [Oligoflexia bacterium]|nr:hypothetical protein [Oligoflexia bacterium]
MKEMRQEFADTLKEVGTADQRLVVLVGDISHFRLVEYAKACPGRYYNVGICEPTIVNMAAGLSMAGLIPVVHTIAPFIVERSFEQIKLDFCYQKLSGNIITVGSAFDYSTLGCSHHCYGDFGMLKTLPSTQLFFPASPVELNTLFKQTYQTNHLNYFRFPKETHEIEFDAAQVIVGRGMLVRPGRDLTVVVTGPQLKNAMLAATDLSAQGLDAEVLYYPTIKPFDAKLVLDSAKKTRRVLVLEEHSQFGGLGDEVLRCTREISELKYDTIAIKAEFIRGYGSYAELCAIVGLTPQNICAKAKALR